MRISLYLKLNPKHMAIICIQILKPTSRVILLVIEYYLLIFEHFLVDSRRISEFEHPEGMRYSSFNTLLNQSNDFPGMKNAPIDLNSSSVSDRDKDVSLGNLSRNSGYLNSSNSKRNQSSRSNNMRAKNYQVTINEDIKLIERIETVLNAIIANHNKVCPFCNKRKSELCPFVKILLSH